LFYQKDDLKKIIFSRFLVFCAVWVLKNVHSNAIFTDATISKRNYCVKNFLYANAHV